MYILSSFMPGMQTTQNWSFLKTSPIINASFVFIVFLWPWCILPLEFRSQQQIKDLVTLLKDTGQPLNFKTHRTCFPGLSGKVFCISTESVSSALFLLYFTFCQPPQRPTDIPEKQLDCMPFTDCAKLSVLVTLEGSDASASTSHPGEGEITSQYSWLKMNTQRNTNSSSCWKARQNWLLNLLYTKFRETDLS